MNSRVLCVLQGCEVVQWEDGRGEFIADGDIDADGGYHAYHHVSSIGLDNLANAGHPDKYDENGNKIAPANWWGIVTDNGRPDGVPVIQGDRDPAPGFYVSTTAYEWPLFERHDPRRYLNSEDVPFIVVEGYIRRRAQGVVLGCKAQVSLGHRDSEHHNLVFGDPVPCVVGDIGPLNKIGELSIAAAHGLGVNPDPRRGGVAEKIIKYELWPGVPAILNGLTYNLIASH